MKVLIISDIHDDFDSLKKAITNHPKIDHLVLLGDLGYYNEQVFNLLNLFKDIIISVKGNNDFLNDSIKFKNDDYYQTISIDNKTWFITHGHMYNEYNLPKVDFDIYLQGHTHRAKIEKKDKLYLNPGSISLPRNGIKTYMYYENNTFYLENLDKEVLDEITI